MTAIITPQKVLSPAGNSFRVGQPNKSPAAEAIRAYLKRVVPWGSGGSINVHYFPAAREGDRSKPPMFGVPCKTLDEAVSATLRLLGDPKARDLYVCMSAQREDEEKVTASGRTLRVAKRSAENALALKSFYVDLDVKAGAYPRREAAVRALGRFIKDCGLPVFSTAVASGTGGLHIYWVLDKAIPADEWQPIADALAEAAQAHGLKFDSQCTVDSARVLRIPATWNYKNGGKAPVELKMINGADVTVDQMCTALAAYLGRERPALVRRQGVEPLPEGFGRPSKVFARGAVNENDEFSAGIQQGAALRRIKDVAAGCGWIKHSLDTGGVDNDNMLRRIAHQVATFCEDTDGTAWALMGNRATLTEAEFWEQLDRAKAERGAGERGFPSCAVICKAGATQCATCQHFNLGKSPLSVPGTKPAAVLPSQVIAPLVDVGLPDIKGGTYKPDDAMREISARFALVDREGEVLHVHRTKDGRDHVLAKGSFALHLANVKVEVGSQGKVEHRRADAWWTESSNRPPIRYAVFKPHDPEAPDEYNFWRGFGVKCEPGTDKIRRLLKHTFDIICRRDREKFRYLMRWLAWAVQHPDENPGTSVVLKGESEGSGKSTLGYVMRRLFGDAHSVKISDPMQVFGPHVDHLEYVCFLLAEEALWAGDPKIKDRVKDFITGETIHINPKGRKAYSAKNMIHAMLTTNHDWAIPAGKNARRWFVCEVSDDKICDKEWFDRLYDDLNAGGYGQFLNFLLNLKLDHWHPRKLHRTTELLEQQLHSASPIKHWLLACADEGRIRMYDLAAGAFDLNTEHPTGTLHEAFCGYMRATSGRGGMSNVAFGRELRSIFGAAGFNAKVKLGTGDRKPGYLIPNAAEIRRAVEHSINSRT